jgi:hypothetical protein
MNDCKSAFYISLEGEQDIKMYRIPCSFVNDCVEELISISKKEPSINILSNEIVPLKLLTTV